MVFPNNPGSHQTKPGGVEQMPGMASHEVGGASPADMYAQAEASPGLQKPLTDRAKDIGKSAVEIGTKIYHKAEDRVHEIKSQDHQLEPTRKQKMIAGAGAGTVALASTARAIAKRRSKHTPKMSVPKMTAPHTMLARAREAVPFKR